jgi:hypothetical protein
MSKILRLLSRFGTLLRRNYSEPDWFFNGALQQSKLPAYAHIHNNHALCITLFQTRCFIGNRTY